MHRADMENCQRCMAAWAVPSTHNAFLNCAKAHPKSSAALHRKRVHVAKTRMLSQDEKSFADAAVKVWRQFMLGNDIATFSTLELFAFCSVKGIALKSNAWDRMELEAKSLEYFEREKISRIKDGPGWNEMEERDKIGLLHQVCNAEGDVTYIDPATGYTVFSYYAHLKRRNCCGVRQCDNEKGYERTHRCRHCPYSDAGLVVSNKIRALNDRLDVIDYVRQQITHHHDASDVAPQHAMSMPVSSGNIKSPRVRRVRRQSSQTNSAASCKVCNDEKVVSCTRCNGWTYMFTPKMRPCKQCGATGEHPCLHCTSFRPPQLSSFYD